MFSDCFDIGYETSRSTLVPDGFKLYVAVNDPTEFLCRLIRGVYQLFMDVSKQCDFKLLELSLER